jgi:hypothetical protein
MNIYLILSLDYKRKQKKEGEELHKKNTKDGYGPHTNVKTVLSEFHWTLLIVVITQRNSAIGTIVTIPFPEMKITATHTKRRSALGLDVTAWLTGTRSSAGNTRTLSIVIGLAVEM